MGTAPAPTGAPTGTADDTGPQATTHKSAPHVKITARVRWDGGGDIARYVTPVEIRIENKSDAFLRIAPEQFALLGSDGRYFAALPWFAMRGPACDPEAVSGYGAQEDPEVESDGLSVPLALSAVYPNLPSFNGTYCYSQRFQARYLSYWKSIPVPTPDMVERMIPPGILAPGGSVTGYLYFERVPDPSKVHLRTDLEDAFTAERLAAHLVGLSD